MTHKHLLKHKLKNIYIYRPVLISIGKSLLSILSSEWRFTL